MLIIETDGGVVSVSGPRKSTVPKTISSDEYGAAIGFCEPVEFPLLSLAQITILNVPASSRDNGRTLNTL